MALDRHSKFSVGRGYGPRFALGQASRLKWLLLSVPIWTALLGLEAGWQIACSRATDRPVVVERQLSPGTARLERLIQEAHLRRLLSNAR